MTQCAALEGGTNLNVVKNHVNFFSLEIKLLFWIKENEPIHLVMMTTPNIKFKKKFNQNVDF